MDTNSYLDHKFRVSSCDIDLWGRMKPTSLLNICQEVAYSHSSLLGFGFDKLSELNLAWVLSRVKVEIERMPLWREEIRVRTWHKRQSGLFALRDYIYYDSLGNPIIKVTTSWLIINLATRRISRVDRVFNSSSELGAYDVDAIAQEAERVELKGEPTAAEPHKVAYSDLDLNRHVNNAKYIEWICDNSPLQLSQQHTLKSFCINFNHEATLGEVVELNTAPSPEGETLFEGHNQGRSIFTAKLRYEG